MDKPSLIPSLALWRLERALPAFWGVLEPVERFRIAAYLLLPTLNRFALLGGFAVTMKGFVAVSREGADDSLVWIRALVILGLLSLAAILQFAQHRTFLEINRDLRRAVRRVVGREMIRLGTGPRAAGARPEDDVVVEKELSKGVGPGLLAAVELASGLLFITLVLAVITLALPLAGAVMAVIGVALLAVFRLRILRAKVAPAREAAGSLAERRDLVASMLAGSADEDALREYEFNGSDLSHEDDNHRRKGNEARISMFSAGVSALIVTICFLLVAFTGLRLHDPIYLILFVIAVRLFVVQGKQLLKQWAEILGRRRTLFAFIMILSGRDGFAKLRARDGWRGNSLPVEISGELELE